MPKPLPFKFQEKHVCDMINVLRDNRFALDGSDVGSGKTFCSLFAAQALNLTPAVLCPKSMISDWRSACSLFGITPKWVTNYEKVIISKAKGSPIRRINSRKWDFGLGPNDILIFDEAHKLKGFKTKTTEMGVSAAAPWNDFKGLFLSATIADNPLHFKAIGQALNLFGPGGFWGWAMSNGVVKGKWAFEFVKNKGLQREFISKIHRSIFPAHGSRIKVSEIPDFPKNNIFPKGLDVDQKDLDSVEEELKALAEKALGDAFVPVVEQLRLRQKYELLKVRSIAEMASNLYEEGQSVVIFADFLGTIHALSERIPNELKARVICGETPADERAEIVRLFQENKIFCIIAQSQVGGVGLSLHDLNGRPRSSIISPTYSAVNFRQIVGRICRAGSLSPATQYVTYCRNSIEEKVIKKVETKLQNLDLLLDGDFDFVSILKKDEATE